MKKPKLPAWAAEPDAWVIEWMDAGDEITKQKWRAELGRACGANVRELHYGWGAAACCCVLPDGDPAIPDIPTLITKFRNARRGIDTFSLAVTEEERDWLIRALETMTVRFYAACDRAEQAEIDRLKRTSGEG